jgi:hypothetical protein
MSIINNIGNVKVKIKTSFITNSSSTAYVIFVPDDFAVNENYIENLYHKIVNKIKDDYNVEKIGDLLDG